MSPPKEAPNAASSDDAGPRSRVLDLVRRVARATALGSAGLGLAAAESCTPLVCDPLPPPITCANPTRHELQSALDLRAVWQAGDAGTLELRLTVQNNGRQAVTFSPTVTATNATVRGSTTTSSSLTADLAPSAGASTVTVTVSFDCAGTNDLVTLSLNVSGTPAAGTTVPVTITSP